MSDLFQAITGLIADLLAAIHRPLREEDGSSTVETAIIVASMAAMAIAAMAVIAAAVDAKVGALQL